jgi:hypothetical protein
MVGLIYMIKLRKVLKMEKNYSVGDTLYFRYGYNIPASATIKRINKKSVTLENFEGINTKQLKTDKMNVSQQFVRGTNDYYKLINIEKSIYDKIKKIHDTNNTLMKHGINPSLIRAKFEKLIRIAEILNEK